MANVKFEVRDQVAIVTIDRPPVNAVTREVGQELCRIFESFREDKSVNVAILTGQGRRAFVAGTDLKVMDQQQEKPLSTLIDRGYSGRRSFWSIYDCAIPVIAAVNGPAIGAGLAYAAVCDIIIAADHATFATTEINVGLLGASSHLALMLPRHKVRELFLTGEAITAQELHGLGVVRAVVPVADLMPTALQLARELARKSPIALRLAKESANRTEFMELKEAYRTEQDYTARLLAFDDSGEARRAYLEKRDPKWTWA